MGVFLVIHAPWLKGLQEPIFASQPPAPLEACNLYSGLTLMSINVIQGQHEHFRGNVFEGALMHAAKEK